MNSKLKSLGGRIKKDNSLAVNQQAQTSANKRSKSSSPNDVIVINKPGTTIDITFKKSGRKSSSTMVSSRGSSGAKTAEEKKQPSDIYLDGETIKWSKTLREQSHSAMTQGMRQLGVRLPPSKPSGNEHSYRREIKTGTDTRRSHNHRDSRTLDEIPVKQPAKRPSSRSKSIPMTNSAVPSTTTIASSLESVVVVDRGVQCGGVFDCSNDKFSVFNPVRMLGILMKEMEGLVRDERSSKILREMEQALFNIPMEYGQPSPADLKKVELGTKLEAGTAKLEHTSKKIELVCTKLREDKESLQQQVNKQALMIEESQQREREMEMTMKQMKLDMNEVLRSAAENRRTISILKEEKKTGMEVAQKLASDLRRELNEQIELAQERFMEVQYLKLEREKLLAMSAYKDSTLIELRKTLKDLQNHISEQLVDIREAGKRVKETSSGQQISVIHGGIACSSPTSTSSKNSLGQQSCPELSEMSLSLIDCFSHSDVRKDKQLSNNELPVFSCSTDILDDSETQKNTDKTQLEFISLPGGETSCTISMNQQKDDESIVPIVDAEKKNEEASKNNRKLEVFHSTPNIRIGENSSQRPDNKDNRGKVKGRKLSENLDKKREESKRVEKSERCSGEPASIKEQFEMMFEDIRMQSKFPVRVPSPPRNYPRPDWSDCSLPTISGISESNVA